MNLHYRKALPEDVDTLFSWRNNPEVFKYFFHPHTVTYGEHIWWFDMLLKNPDQVMYIVEVDAVPVGYLRVDLAHERELSWAVVPEVQGRGIGKAMLIHARQMFPGMLTAKVLFSNTISRHVAESVGFVCIKQEDGVCYYRTIS